MPLFQGLRVNSRTRQAHRLLDASGQDLDDVQRGVVRETQNAYRAILAGIQEVQAFEQAKISAESALEATQAGFEVGTRTIVDVLIAEQRKYQAQRDNSVARHLYIIRHLRLKSVAGLLAFRRFAAPSISCSNKQAVNNFQGAIQCALAAFDQLKSQPGPSGREAPAH